MPLHRHKESQKQPNNQTTMAKMVSLYHSHDLSPNQCCSRLVQPIDAPLPLVWSVVRRFDYPQAYKQFIKNCTITSSDSGAGSVREITLVSGLPARTSTERLERLEDDLHLIEVSIIGGDHRLTNYRSTTTLHEEAAEGGGRAVVIESYVVDVPVDSCEEDTCLFADTIIGLNLRSLAKITEKRASEV